MTAAELITAIAALIGAVAGCSLLIKAIWRALHGGEERRANAVEKLTASAARMVDELQEEVKAARTETQKAREETEELRNLIREMRRLTDEEIGHLRTQVQVLKEQNHDLRTQLNHRRP